MAGAITFDLVAMDKATAALAQVGREVSALGEQINRAGGDIPIDADTARAREKVADLNATLGRLNARAFKIDADISGAQRDIAVLEAELKRATGDRKVKVEADLDTARARLRALEAQKVSIDLDTSKASASRPMQAMGTPPMVTA